MPLNILAIDDSLTIRTLVSQTLKNAGHNVEIAVDGNDGIRVFQEYETDIVVTDLNMPNLDGFGVIEKIRSGEKNNRVPIMILTTENSSDLKNRAREIGASGWITKPFNEDTLLSAIERVAGV